MADTVMKRNNKAEKELEERVVKYALDKDKRDQEEEERRK